MSNSSLELLFDHLEKDAYTGINSILPKANGHYDDLLKQFKNLSSSQGVRFTPFYIEAILQHCEGSRFPKAKYYVENGRREFERIIGILSNKNYMVQSCTTKATEKLPISNNSRYEEDQFPDHIPVYNSSVEHKPNISDTSTKPIGNEEGNEHQSSEYTDVWDGEKVRKMFTHLYDEVWSVAHEDLQKTLTDHRTINKVLLAIFEKAFSFTKTESETLILCMIEALSDVVTSPIEKGKNAGDKEFVNTVLPDVLDRLYGRTRQPSVELRRYAREAVEVTWWMNVQTPPMMIMDDINDISKYSPILRRATNKIDYIVWPALLHSINGTLLEKGIAVFM